MEEALSWEKKKTTRSRAEPVVKNQTMLWLVPNRRALSWGTDQGEDEKSLQIEQGLWEEWKTFIDGACGNEHKSTVDQEASLERNENTL